MANIEDIHIPQQEIDQVMSMNKLLDFKYASWNKKQPNQPSPYWLELKLPFLDQSGLPIPQLYAYFSYRPARREGLIPSMSFIAFYKNRRIFAVDQGQCLAHSKKKINLIPPAQQHNKRAHYHILHGRENQETGYRLEEKYQKSCDFLELMCYFLQQFKVTVNGTIPHPILSNNGQMELL